MKKLVFKLGGTLLLCLFIISCNKDENTTRVPTDSTAEIENSQKTISSLPTNYFAPKNLPIKGIVILGSGNDPQNPTPGNINDPYLIDLSKSLAAKGFVCAIVQYRDQPFVGNNFENFNANTLMLVEDFNNVGNALIAELGLSRTKLIFGGSSYSANCLLSQNAWGSSITDIKGIIAVMGSSALDTAQNQKAPVLAFACNGEPFGTHYGQSLVQNITNATVKTKSFGLTDNSCSGHATSNPWIPIIIDKVLAWTS
ncbi:hypothetical protein [Flavobacterium sp.]|uniref:hypothetical protein n=1 Tax=Flavobacterium sp. TaxID=239 RepID=UPI003263D5B0